MLSVVVKPEAQIEYEDFGKKNVASLKREEVKEAILHAGMWPFIKQRPYDIVASPADEPRDIFVSAFYSAPLAPNFDFDRKLIFRRDWMRLQNLPTARCMSASAKVLPLV